VRIISVNLNKRLRSETNIRKIEKWLSSKNADLLFVQEPWERGRKSIVPIKSYLYLGGTDGIGAWIHESYVPQCTELLKENWQKLTFNSLTIHNVYLPASSSDAKNRIEFLEQLNKQISKEQSSYVLVVGDFNLAPNPEDGLYNEEFSNFTSKRERDAFKSFLSTNNLIDSTALNSHIANNIFSIERTINGKKSCFRCDLALVSESIFSDMNVEYDHSVRMGDESFTDHSAIVIDIPDSFALLRSDKCNSYKTAISQNDSSRVAKELSVYLKSKYPDMNISRIFDYGCGHRIDAEFYENEFDCHAGRWDPYISSRMKECPYGKYDIITCTFVLNVIPDVSERINTIKRAISYVSDGGFLVLATRSARAINREASNKGWKSHKDGYLSSESKGTFQKGIDVEEIESYLVDSGLKVRITNSSELKVQDATVVLIKPLLGG
jgi:exonuclease III